jgi:phosphatidylserine/phosphatidylglycerophosphate/cardiolipin synthase-like enzyme
MSRALSLTLLIGCAGPDTSGMFNQVDLTLPAESSEVNAAFVDAADRATTQLLVALPGITDLSVSDALIAAADRDVEVLVVVDLDNGEDEGVQALVDAGIPVRLADGDLTYFDFSLNADVAWTSDQVHMTHAFAVIDGLDFVLANAAGDLDDGDRVVFTGTSQELCEDLATEHNQVFGGSDATAKTAFDALAKSVADVRWIYPTQSDELLQVWFNPQERLVKRVIDAVYNAKSSVRIMSHDLADEGLARALQQKADDGFDVEVLVGEGFGTTSTALSDVLLEQAPDVPLLQATTSAALPTLVFIDYDKAVDGHFHQPMAMVLTHPLWSAARLFNDREVINDQMVDGALYVLSVQGSPSTPLQDLAAIYAFHRADAEAVR